MSWGIDGLAPPRRWLLLLLATAITALAIYLRLYHLGRPSFWHDEVFSLGIIDRPFAQLWGIYYDVHPPLYYVLLKGWLGLVGHDEYGLRLLSVLFSLATLPALYLIGRRIGGPWLGLATLFCLAISPFAVDYAQEVRSYAFLGCIGAWALYGFTRLLAAPEVAALPLRRSDRLAWILVGGGSLLALYTHNLGLLLPFATTVIVAVAWWGRPERGRLARNWTVVHALVLLLWVPWLPELWKQAQHVGGYSWIPAPSLDTIVQTELSIAFGLRRYAQVWTWLTGAGLLSLAVIGGLALPRRPRWAVILVALFVLPALGSLAITWLHRPVYLPRTFIWSGFPIAVFLGAGIVVLLARARGWRLALAVAVLLLLVAGNSYTLTRTTGATWLESSTRWSVPTTW